MGRHPIRDRPECTHAGKTTDRPAKTGFIANGKTSGPESDGTRDSPASRTARLLRPEFQVFEG